MIQTSLIISVYKNTTFLKAVLDSIAFQTVKPSEIIISEDGHDLQMDAFVQQYNFDIPYQHLTQEDIGWRKNQALNKAIRSANYEYLIFIDGDCVLHPHFIENHIALAGEKKILAGKRVKLGDSFSKKLLQSNVQVFSQNFMRDYSLIKDEGGKFCEEGITLPLNYITRQLIKFLGISSIKGCNFSCYKEAIIDINGFDEEYIRPAIGEDIDLVWRFKGLGYKITSIKHFCVQYHLNHKESWTDQSENEKMMHQKMTQKTFRCVHGLKQLQHQI